MGHATLEIYRHSKIGKCLEQALDEIVMAGKIPPLLAVKVITQFDKSIMDALESKVSNKISFKGHLHAYRFMDHIWNLMLEDAKFKRDGHEQTLDRVKIVAFDTKLVPSISQNRGKASMTNNAGGSGTTFNHDEVGLL